MKTAQALVMLIGVAGLACKGAAPEPSPVPAAASVPAAAHAPAKAGVSGSVLETMDAGGYTYLRLKTDTGEVWAAVQQASVKVGATVTIVDAMPMEGFQSKTLGRTFDHILFGSLGEGASTSGSAPAPDMVAAHAGVQSGPDDAGAISVPRATGADAKTVAEIFAQRVALADKPVAVRGKVVKFLSGIMGRNWVHLRDGSGTRAAKDDDLTVTTADGADVGDVILVKGVVRNDRDFGAGYAYPVIVEQATLSK